MSIEPYFLDRLHVDRERLFLEEAARRRAVRAIAPSRTSPRVLRWWPTGPLGWARRFASAIAVVPAPTDGLHP